MATAAAAHAASRISRFIVLSPSLKAPLGCRGTPAPQCLEFAGDGSGRGNELKGESSRLCPARTQKSRIQNTTASWRSRSGKLGYLCVSRKENLCEDGCKRGAFTMAVDASRACAA